MKEVLVKEQVFSFDGIPVHYIEAGKGFPILMIHGSGPGASTLGNWRLVLEPLAASFHIYAMDLVGFGKSGRKRSGPYFDVPLWVDQCRALIRRIGAQQVGIIGHSISAALALKLATVESAVTKVMTTGLMGAVFQPTADTFRAWTFPKDRGELRQAAEALIYDKALIDDAYLENREKVLFSGDYEQYFSDMFSGDKRRFIDQSCLSAEELGNIKCDVLMVHGRNDSAFPAEDLTLRISKSLPHAHVVLLGRCSHSVAYEHPAMFISLAEAFFPHGEGER